jgi:hypothetical protein
MADPFMLLLFLHVLGAIVALGPTFAFPLLGAMARREPEHGGFATRATILIDDRIVRPVVLVTGLTGLAMIWWRSIAVLAPAYRWLLVAIVMYVLALAISLLVQRPAVQRAVVLMSGPADPGSQLPATLARVARTGMVLTFLALGPGVPDGRQAAPWRVMTTLPSCA